MPPSRLSVDDHGKCQPPKNRITIRKLVVIMCVYSPRKNMANFMALYSV